jgi:6-phosphogluconate dehydrogenase (decarboxylating)
MGASMLLRLLEAGHECVVHDARPEAAEAQAAIEAGVPVPVLATALFARFRSQSERRFADQVLSTMRHAFGGHAEKARP